MAETFNDATKNMREIIKLIEIDLFNSIKSIGDDELQAKFEKNMKFHVELLFKKRENLEDY